MESKLIVYTVSVSILGQLDRQILDGIPVPETLLIELVWIRQAFSLKHILVEAHEERMTVVVRNSYREVEPRSSKTGGDRRVLLSSNPGHAVEIALRQDLAHIEERTLGCEIEEVGVRQSPVIPRGLA